MICKKEPSIFFEITNICNHNCIHCCKQWEDNSINRFADKTILDKIINMPKSNLTISGGEPSLVKDQVYYLIRNEKKPITINTNLTGWNKDDISFFNFNNKIELNVSVVSLDEQVYRKVTKANTFNIFIDNLFSLNNKHFITVVANPLNLNSIEYTVKLLILKGFKNILVTPQVPSRKSRINVKQVLNIVNKLYLNFKNVANISTQGFCEALCSDHTCEAGIGRLLVDSKGDVYPCAPIHKECKLGTIDTDFNLLKENGKQFYYSYPQEQRLLCKGFLNV